MPPGDFRAHLYFFFFFLVDDEAGLRADDFAGFFAAVFADFVDDFAVFFDGAAFAGLLVAVLADGAGTDLGAAGVTTSTGREGSLGRGKFFKVTGGSKCVGASRLATRKITAASALKPSTPP